MLRLFILLLALFATPLAAEEAGYIGSAACAACHKDETQAWKTSDHAHAWTPATPVNILGDFDDTHFDLGQMHVAFSIAADGSRHATVTELDGTTTDYTVQSVVGIHPLQQYLFATKDGRLQSFDVVWDTVNKRWFHLYPDQNVPPEDGMHWTGPYKTWNSRCASCHATDFHANYDADTHSFASTEAEIGVGCEACHGPGSVHRDWALRWKTTREAPPANFGFAIDLTDRKTMMEACAGCHSRREALVDGTPVAGTSYADNYNLQLPIPPFYYPDGQIRQEDYVWGSFLQSKMYAKGVSCANCHDPHTGERLAPGNSVCLQCHTPAGNPDFPSLPLKEFDSPSHTHHPMGSTGAECKSCHMPEQVYMGNDWRADHSFRIPRPDLDAVTGAPDACTMCHKDKTPDWAAAQIAQWFPDSTHRGPHYGAVLAHGAADPAAAAGDLTRLAGDMDRTDIVRAAALWMIGQGAGAQAADAVEGLLSDPDPLVRRAAIEAQDAASAQNRITRVAGLLGDPVRSVRIAAAKALLGAPIAYMPPKMAADLKTANGEWQAAMGTRLDFPETQMQLAGVGLTLRNFPAAAGAFAEATSMDPQLVDAWVMQIRIADALGNNAKAVALANAAVAANPSDLTLGDMRAQLTGTAPDLTPPK